VSDYREVGPVKQGRHRLAARAALEKIYRAAVGAADPVRLLRQKLRLLSDRLELPEAGARFWARRDLYVIAAGKGVERTREFWERCDRVREGVLVGRRGDARPQRRGRIAQLAASHPLPDEASFGAALSCARLLEKTAYGDWVIFLLMGGASSLLAWPAPGLTLDDKRKTTGLLLKSGMSIAEINAVRKHLSRVKAGGLLRRAYPARVLTLAISDVIGDDPSVIGSAPTYYDPTTFGAALGLLARYGVLERLPRRVRGHLRRGARGELPETMKPESRLADLHPYFVIANWRTALAEAQRAAESLGFSCTVTSEPLTGDTRAAAGRFCREIARALADRSRRRPHGLFAAGETTVAVKGSGLGGRNQEFALACALELAGAPGVYLLSAGSDGIDGFTDVAGAFADGTTLGRAVARGLDPRAALARNDSYRFFRELGDLFAPGPTGTNVLDLKLALLY
jgi:glycerate 2-kinase